MLDLDPNRPPTPPRLAATTLVLRPGAPGVEVLAILRHPKSTFLGGMLAIPGGQVDAQDSDRAWGALAEGLPGRIEAAGASDPRALAVAACRELLEEVGVLPVAGLDHAGALALREKLKAGGTFAGAVAALGGPLRLGELQMFGRWVTPEAEARRYDATFFVMPLPAGQEGSSDQHETTALLWDTPARLLERWGAGELQMAPPTARMLELLAGCASVDEALALAGRQHLGPVCPRFVPDESGGYLALPGDPSHGVSERRVEGGSRFVLRDGRFVSADPPQSPSR